MSAFFNPGALPSDEPVLLSVQGRQTDVGVVEADDPLFPEVFFVRIPADAVQPDAQEQGDRQHRQPGVAPQLDVVLEHPRAERRGAVWRLNLDMDQRHQVGHARAGRWRAGPEFQAGHQVELPLFPLRGCQEQLLVPPVNRDELEPRRPGGKKQRKNASKNSLSSTFMRWS